MILRIIPSEAERVAGSLGVETIEQASRSFRVDGALIIEDIVDTALIAKARRAFAEGYSHYLDGVKHEDALAAGERGGVITVNFEAPFDHAKGVLYSNLFSPFSDSLSHGSCSCGV